jgi:hypothetical protein
VEAESDLAFAGLHELLRPVLDHLGEVPDIQSQALAGALGLAASTHADRLLISAAVLGLLAAAAEERPTLCVVDDAQWLDRPSADALVFTARRLRAECLAIVFAAREGEAARFEAAGLAELTLTGLAEQPATTVLASRGRRAPPGVRDRLLAEAAGNPLALMELAGGLSEEQLAGLVPLPEAMPLTPRLEGVFRQRIGQLPSVAQDALLIVAADNTGDAAAVLRAAAGLRLEHLRTGVAAVPTHTRHALLARCEALPGVRDPDEAFSEALATTAALPPLQRARTELLYGEWLRRERRRTESQSG